MKNLFFFLLMAGLTSMMSCTAEKGDIGLTGPAGQDGIDGTNGQNGTNGNDGNANIKSYTTTVNASDWTSVAPTMNAIDLSVAIVTEEVANHGMVMAYLQTGSYGTDPIWSAMPFSRQVFDNYYQGYDFWVIPGNVRLHSTASNGNPDAPTTQVRIIAATSEGLARNPDLDWTNYEAVSKALNLAE